MLLTPSSRNIVSIPNFSCRIRDGFRSWNCSEDRQIETVQTIMTPCWSKQQQDRERFPKAPLSGPVNVGPSAIWTSLSEANSQHLNSNKF